MCRVDSTLSVRNVIAHERVKHDAPAEGSFTALEQLSFPPAGSLTPSCARICEPSQAAHARGAIIIGNSLAGAGG